MIFFFTRISINIYAEILNIFLRPDHLFYVAYFDNLFFYRKQTLQAYMYVIIENLTSWNRDVLLFVPAILLKFFHKKLKRIESNVTISFF